MPTQFTARSARRHTPGAVVLRPGRLIDIGALCAIESRAFTHNRLSARSFARFIRSPGSSLIVAEAKGVVSAYALTLFRKRSRRARLYSLAVDPAARGRKLGSRLLQAAEAAALRRQCEAMHLEARPGNRTALSLYGKFGYRVARELGAYYEDGGKALRLEKALTKSIAVRDRTCG